MIAKFLPWYHASLIAAVACYHRICYWGSGLQMNPDESCRSQQDDECARLEFGAYQRVSSLLKTLTQHKKKPMQGFHLISPMQPDPVTAH